MPFKREQHNWTRKIIASVMIMVFSSSLITFPIQNASAKNIGIGLTLPPVGTMITTSPAFSPAVIKGIKIFPDNPLRFDFIIDTGNSGLDVGAQDFEPLQKESQKLIKYFLAALTVPEEDLWVNLSPYESDRIIPNALGETEMGRDLLAQDYILKQLTASLIYPEDELGKDFWNKVYSKAQELFGTTEVPINTFNKVWIVPEKAVVYENANIGFIVESKLKVMLEGDYLALENNSNSEKFGTDKLGNNDIKKVSNFSSDIVRDIILPAIEKEVNEGTHFANLRQIYHSMILATWFKRKLTTGTDRDLSVLGKVYIDQNKIVGVDVKDKQIKQKIYAQYVEAFKTGVYNYIRADYDINKQKEIPRKYFSGGFLFNLRNKVTYHKFTENTWDTVVNSLLGIVMSMSTQLDPQSSHSMIPQIYPVQHVLSPLSETYTEEKMKKSSSPIKNKDNQPLISVIIATYNMGKNLKNVINSVLQQTYKNFEIIVINDGSTDNTNEIMHRITKENPRIKYISNDINEGRSTALNRGLEIFNGKYVTFLDADDTFPKDSLKVRLEHLQSNPDLDFVYTSAAYVMNGETQSIKIAQPIKSSENLSRKLLLSPTVPFARATVMYKKDVFTPHDEETIRFDPKARRGQDLDLLLQIAKKGYQAGAIDTVTYNYFLETHDIWARLHNRLQSWMSSMSMVSKYVNGPFRQIYYYTNISIVSGLKFVLEIFSNNKNPEIVRIVALNEFSNIRRNTKTKNVYKKDNVASSSLSLTKTEKSNAQSYDLKNTGGIDLAPSKLDLQTKGQGLDFNAPFDGKPFNGLPCIDDDHDGICERVDMEAFESMNINGFTPVIFQITPVTNLQLLLGINETPDPIDTAQEQESRDMSFIDMGENKYYRKIWYGEDDYMAGLSVL